MKKRFPYETDDVELIRFLKARGYNAEKAAGMYDAHLKWKSATLPIELSPELEESARAAKRFYLLEETDGQGRPVIYYNLLKYKEWGVDMEAELKVLIDTMEKMLKDLKNRPFQDQQYVALVQSAHVETQEKSVLSKSLGEAAI